MTEKNDLVQRYRQLCKMRQAVEGRAEELKKQTVSGDLGAIANRLLTVEQEVELHKTAEAKVLERLEVLLTQELKAEYEQIPIKQQRVKTLRRQYHEKYGAALAAVRHFSRVSGLPGADQINGAILEAVEAMERTGDRFPDVLRGFNTNIPPLDDIDGDVEFCRVTKPRVPGSAEARKVVNKRMRALLPELPLPPEPKKEQLIFHGKL